MPKTIQRWTRSHEFWLLAVVVILSMFLTAATDSFLTLQNLFDLLTSTSFAGILAAGLLVVLVFGGIDISFTAIASVAQYVALTIAKTYPIGWFGVFFVACCIGILCGLFNAAIIHKVRISSVIVTISTLNIFYGSLIYITRGDYITSLPTYFREGIWWFEFTDSNGFPYAINLQALLLVVSFFMTWVLLNKTNIGRQICAMGGNEIAAERLGFHVFGLRCLVYGYMGFMAAIASISQAQLAQSVTPTTLIGKELEVLAAVVLGGASLTGGKGTVFGAVLGVMLIAILQNGLILLGVSSYWNQFFVGCVILLAVSATALSQRRRHAGLAS